MDIQTPDLRALGCAAVRKQAWVLSAGNIRRRQQSSQPTAGQVGV